MNKEFKEDKYIPYKKDKPYPKWDPEKPNEKPGIPEWSREFGNITIEFSGGTRTCYYHKQKLKKDVVCGDYIIKITYEIKNWNKKNINDFEAWKWLIECLNSKEAVDMFLQHLCKILDMEVDDEVYNYLINNVKFNEKTDEIRALLYYFWHRAIIEDRLYSQKKGYNGRKQIIGATYGILMKLKNNLNYLNNLIDECKKIYKKAQNKCPECVKWYNFLIGEYCKNIK